MKASIILPKPQPVVLELTFDSEAQYALFRQFFTTSCVCEAFRRMNEPELGRLWDEILPTVPAVSAYDCSQITALLKKL